MALEALKNANRVIGIKQVTKALRKGIAQGVYVADDADAHYIEPLLESCREQSVELVHVETMKALGEACGIEVGAAAAAILSEAYVVRNIAALP